MILSAATTTTLGTMMTQAEPSKTPGSARVRPPSTVYTLQALRGIAALLVVFHHAGTMWYFEVRHALPLIPFNGTTGVDIFFVISGFIMPLSIRKIGSHASTASTFLVRRLERIVPLYWLATLLKLMLLSADPSMSESGLGSRWHVLSSFLFLPSFNPLNRVGPLLQPGWTLNWEMLFYVLIALALLLGAPLRYFLPPVLLALGALRFTHPPAWLPLDTVTIPLMVEFLFGLALAVRYRARTLSGQAAMPAALAAILFMGAFVTLVFYPPAARQPLVYGGFLAAAVVGAALELEQRIGRHIPQLLLLLGDASYSIYLTHWFLISVFRRTLARTPLATASTGLPALLLMVLISCVVGVLTYWLVERPINNYFHVRRRTATAA